MSKLTDIAVRKLRAKADRYEVSDNGGPLRVIVQPSGVRGYAVRFRFQGATRKLTLPANISLAEARKLAATAMHDVAQGRDPTAEKRTAKEKAANEAKDTLQGLCHTYMQREGRKLRTADYREQFLRRLVFPRLGDRPVNSVTRRDIVKLLDEIEDGHGARTADIALAYLRRILRWHSARDDSYNSPIVPGMGRHNSLEHARDRTLSDDEVRAVWHACGDLGIGGALVRFLLLTSARRLEAARLEYTEIDDTGLWELPASRSKIKKPVARPLSRAALAIVHAQPVIDGCKFVFSTDGVRPFSSFGRLMHQVREHSKTSGWQLHDLRRSARSLMSRAGVNPDHAERVLGHVIGGVRGVYDRHEFYNEKKHALEKLAGLITRIVDPQPNVTALHG